MDARLLLQLLVAFLVLSVALRLLWVMGAADWMRVMFAAREGRYILPLVPLWFDVHRSVTAFIELSTFVFGVLTIRRLYHNGAALGAGGSRRWVVPRLIVPIVNAITAFPIIRDAWAASRPDHDGTNWREPASGRLIVWWVLWIGGAAIRVALSSALAFRLLGMFWVNAGLMVTNLMLACSFVLCAVILWAIHGRQVERARRILSSAVVQRRRNEEDLLLTEQRRRVALERMDAIDDEQKPKVRRKKRNRPTTSEE